MGLALAFASSDVDHNSFPVFASKARKRRSLVAPMNTRPPAVTVGPALPLFPTRRLPSGSASLVPSTDCHAIVPLLASTAISFDHGGRWHGNIGPGRARPSSLYPFNGALNEKNGPTPLTLARSYGCLDPRASKL